MSNFLVQMNQGIKDLVYGYIQLIIWKLVLFLSTSVGILNGRDSRALLITDIAKAALDAHVSRKKGTETTTEPIWEYPKGWYQIYQIYFLLSVKTKIFPSLAMEREHCNYPSFSAKTILLSKLRKLQSRKRR